MKTTPTAPKTIVLMKLFTPNYFRRISAAIATAFALWFSLPMGDAKETDKSCRACHDSLGIPHLAVSSPHSDFECIECHRHPLSARFHKGAKTVDEFKKVFPTIAADEIRLAEEQVFAVHKQCQACHETEFKTWSSSRHTFNYGNSFLNTAHNKMEQPIDDCLRCHAMFFNGSVDDIVTPLNNQGPWKMKKSGMASRLSIPCLSCHKIHPSEPPPAMLPSYKGLRVQTQITSSPFVGFYDRREKSFFPLSDLPHPKPNDGMASVPISKDIRIRNCYQCHAPGATHRVKTGDDKTPSGVHAGLSCLDCHNPHALSARDSCAKCHPRISHCKLDVAQMDTTAKTPAAKHNIHTVACADCHPKTDTP
jgi:hypothetical protein